MRDSLLQYKGNFSSIRLAMMISICFSSFLFVVASLGFFMNGDREVVIKLLETASFIFSAGVIGKTVQGVAENFKESKKTEDIK